MQKTMILGIPVYFVLMEFFLFGFAGWIYESAFVSIRNRKFVNRGFLIGPILPLYGFGAVSIYLLLRPFTKYPSVLYIMGMLVATLLEYITSVLMERIFHTRWWDYSNAPYNIQGRIALVPSMFWGILALFLFDFLQPAAAWIIEAIPQTVGYTAVKILSFIFCIDVIYSANLAARFRKQLESLYDLKKELESLLDDKHFSSLRELLTVSAKKKTGHSILDAYNEKKEAFYNKLASLRVESDISDTEGQTMEERLKTYWEKRSVFLKNNPLFGNQRLFDAFPAMKLKSRKYSEIEVKELLVTMKKKTGKHGKREK